MKKLIVLMLSISMIITISGCASKEEKAKSSEAFLNAESLYQSEDYSEAIKEYKKVIKEDDDYKEAQEKINNAEDKLYQMRMEQVKELAEEKNYDEAISTLKDMLKDFDNDEINTLIDEYKQSFTDEILSYAKNYADEKDYYNAIVYLSEINADKENYDFASVESKLSEYKQTFEDYALTQSVALVKEKKYDDAVSLLENALDAIPDNEKISKKLQEINNTKPILLNTIKITNSDKFEQITDNAVEDTIGNTYAPGNLFEIHESWGNGFGEFYLGKEYKKLTGVVSPSDNCGDCTGRLEIYSNDKMIYSVKFNRKTTPVSVDVDVTNAEWLKIQVSYVETDDSSGSPYALLSDFQLTK